MKVVFTNLIWFFILCHERNLCNSRIFDTFFAYRHGSNSINLDSARFPYEDEPQVPSSVDDVFGYTAPDADNPSIINIVHCYSIQNGLFGSAKEARVFWSQIDFSRPNEVQRGTAEDIRAISMPISTKIEQFAVYDSDLSVFLMAQTKRLQVVLHVIAGPSVSERPLRTFTFWPNDDRKSFIIDQLILLPQAEKAIFFSAEHFGEISLENYPFADQYAMPEIRVHKVHQGLNLAQNSELLSADRSSSAELLHIQPVYLDTEWADQLFLLLSEVVDGERTLRLDSV